MNLKSIPFPKISSFFNFSTKTAFQFVLQVELLDVF